MRLKLAVFVCLLLGVFLPTSIFAQTTTSSPAEGQVYRARVVEVVGSGTAELDGRPQYWQTLKLKIISGQDKGEEITVDNGKDFVAGVFQKYSIGEAVVISQPGNGAYYIVDRYRNPQLLLIVLLFFALAIYFGRKRGITAIIGMLFSVLVIFYYVIPHILKGGDPLWTSIVGAIVILLVSLYSAHGFNRRTSIALISTLLSLGLAIIIDFAFVYFTKLTGAGTEEAFYLQLGATSLNLRGILMGGIIIGVLGVLDDVTTGQAAAIEEIHDANPALTFTDLYRKGLSVGREHIASLINTLLLAYVGASFPLLLLFNFQGGQPLWLVFNSNFIAEEIVRTLVGSASLILAVPLTTFLAAGYYSRHKKPD